MTTILKALLGGLLGLALGSALCMYLDRAVVDSTKFTARGEEAERSAFLADGAYSRGEFAGG